MVVAMGKLKGKKGIGKVFANNLRRTQAIIQGRLFNFFTHHFPICLSVCLSGTHVQTLYLPAENSNFEIVKILLI